MMYRKPLIKNGVLLCAALVFLTSCHGTVEIETGHAQVTLALGESSLEVVDRKFLEEELSETEEQAHEHSHDTHIADSLNYVFRSFDGLQIVEGELPDTRVLLSEFDEYGEPDPVQVVTGTGLFELVLPAVRGDIELHSSSGELLGSVEFDPEAPLTRQQALMRDADILGPTVKIVNHGTSRDKIDILFLPEGYSQSEMSSFHRHVDAIVSSVRQKPVYRDVWSGFNVLRRDVRSNVSGTGSNARPRDTAFETASGISGVERCVFFANTQGQRAAKRLGDQVGAEVVIVLVNRTQTGACAGNGMIVTSRPAHVADTVAHEIGHALFGLLDEYSTPRPSGHCPTGPNVASSVHSLPWSDMLTTNQLPTPESAQRGTIGAFEGASYCAQGRYRPAHTCLMRSLDEDFCQVCRREVTRKMSRYVSPGSGTPANPSSGSTTTSTQINAPGNLSPNGVQTSDAEVRISWGRVSGATEYKVTIEGRTNGSWRRVAGVDTAATAARVRLQTEGDYRWSVSACKSSGCSSTASATFTYQITASAGTSANTASSSGSTEGLGVPGNLSPATSSTVSEQQPAMSWGSVSGASHYMFKMQWHDGNRWNQYVAAQSVDGTRVRTTLQKPEHWYSFAVQACNSSGCSEWSTPNTMYYRP